MSDENNEKDDAILLIGLGKANLQNEGLYEYLEQHSWITTTRLNGVIDKVELTFWGRQLFNRIQTLQQSQKSKIY